MPGLAIVQVRIRVIVDYLGKIEGNMLDSCAWPSLLVKMIPLFKFDKINDPRGKFKKKNTIVRRAPGSKLGLKATFVGHELSLSLIKPLKVEIWYEY